MLARTFDTIVTRSILVPALASDLGNRIWWPWAGRMAPDDEVAGTRD